MSEQKDPNQNPKEDPKLRYNYSLNKQQQQIIEKQKDKGSFVPQIIQTFTEKCLKQSPVQNHYYTGGMPKSAQKTNVKSTPQLNQPPNHYQTPMKQTPLQKQELKLQDTKQTPNKLINQFKDTELSEIHELSDGTPMDAYQVTQKVKKSDSDSCQNESLVSKTEKFNLKSEQILDQKLKERHRQSEQVKQSGQKCGIKKMDYKLQSHPPLEFIPLNSLPTLNYLATFEQSKHLLKLISDRLLLDHYHITYNNQIGQSMTDQLNAHNQLVYKKILNVHELKVQPPSDLEMIGANEEQNNPFLMSLIDNFESPFPFNDKISLPTLMYTERLDDSVLEAILNIYKQNFPNLFCVPCLAFRSQKVLDQVAKQFSDFNIGIKLGEQTFQDPFDELQLKMSSINQRNQSLIQQQEIKQDDKEFKKQFIFAPFCDGGHWHGLFFEFGKKDAYYFDSLGSTAVAEYQNKFKDLIKQICGIDVNMVKLYINKQNNTYDCGICMLLTLLKILHKQGIKFQNNKVHYNQHEVDGLRHWFLVYFLEWCEFTQNETQAVGPTVINVDDDGVIDIDD